MYFFKTISDDVRSTQLAFYKHSKTKRLVLGALFASIAAVFQAAGGILPGVGYFISPLATAPILFCTMLSLPLGVMSYLLTNLLLLFLQPSELIVFPLTTGLLGIGTGGAFYFFKKRLSIIAAGAVLLTIGVILLLSIFQFPVLGPAVSTSFSFFTTGGIFLFAFIYNWIWVDISYTFFKRIKATRTL
ncbi:hypothetical protein [Bacillus sp. EB600]|uniref:hypothetical protein n=1 Tax=Bacillus sp. EB600 TaxID=2806345 RepID=UPI00210B8C9A|nr:hypothetical protein [Bacillus sp. EB600]MCQ6280620.1 hypothetical protein [Bacillus sp. EB600]